MLGLTWEDIYCHECGRELTYLGGLVAENKRVYCQRQDGVLMLCIANVGLRDSGVTPRYEFRSPEELQIDLRQGKFKLRKRRIKR